MPSNKAYCRFKDNGGPTTVLFQYDDRLSERVKIYGNLQCGAFRRRYKARQNFFLYPRFVSQQDKVFKLCWQSLEVLVKSAQVALPWTDKVKVHEVYSQSLSVMEENGPQQESF